MTVGEKPALLGRRPGIGDALGQLDHFERAGPMRQAADEAALLQPADQPVDARFGTQVQRVLHFVEGGGNAGRAEALIDEHQQLVLLFRQHMILPLVAEQNLNTR